MPTSTPTTTSNLGLNPNSSAVTPHPQDRAEMAASVTERVFLTPRVLDAGTFNAFSEALKELLVDAEDRRVSLSTLAAEMTTLRESLRGLTVELESKLHTAVRVLPAIDQRLSKVNDALTFAEAVVKANAAALQSPHAALGTHEDVAAPKNGAMERVVPAVVPTEVDTTLRARSDAQVFDSRAVDAIEEKLGLVANDLRGGLEAAARAHAAMLDERVDGARAELVEHALTLETDSRSRLEGLLTALVHQTVTQAVEEQMAQARQKMEAELRFEIAAHVQEQVQAAVDAAMERRTSERGTAERAMIEQIDVRIQEKMEPHILAINAAQNAAPTVNYPDPVVERVRQQVEELSRWARSVDTLLSDHSGLVAAQSAHSALAQLATQAAGLGQHLETMTRRAEMTTHTLAGLMAQLPMAGSVVGTGSFGVPGMAVPRDTQR